VFDIGLALQHHSSGNTFHLQVVGTGNALLEFARHRAQNQRQSRR
jgi:hypothetical protein